jgi:hypothetical protein
MKDEPIRDRPPPKFSGHTPRNNLMRILIITGSFPPMRCGVGDYTYQLAESLAQGSGLSVVVLTSRAAATPSTPTAFEVFPVMESWDDSEASTIEEVTRKWSPDLVHIQYPTLGYGRGSLPWRLPLRLYRAGMPSCQGHSSWFGRTINRTQAPF